ncbi:MAG: TonB family protein [Candidatus Latescibacteria bacterium]|nr:TonB family protein [Candidatus Latescibacterota bacterium]NIO56191.1 TonB family protein [Candidatus Latescibacterota bacterium]
MEKPSVHEKREHFKREHPLADVVLEPQSQEVVEDKLKERLAVLQRKKTDKPSKVVALTPSSPVGRPTLAGFANEARSKDRPKDLTRHKPTGSAPVELKRSPEKIQRSTMLATPIPEKTVKPVESDKPDTQAQRTIAGASLTGPVADRPLISFTKPEYPDWAKQEAVEGSVTIYFVVLPDGRVKENVMVQKTSGFGDFDENAINALLAWRFEPMKKGTVGEQWGTITFHYRLSDSY